MKTDGLGERGLTMNCKFCNGQLPEDVTLCPHCGKEQEAEQVADEVTEEVTEKAIGEVAETATAEASTAAASPESTEAQTDKLPFAKDYEAQVPAESGKAAKASPGKIALAVAAGVVLLAVLIALIVAGTSGKKTDAVPETTGKRPLSRPPPARRRKPSLQQSRLKSSATATLPAPCARQATPFPRKRRWLRRMWWLPPWATGC